MLARFSLLKLVDIKEMTSESAKVPEFLKLIDTNLDLYYKSKGIKDYFTCGHGKLSTYCIKHHLHKQSIFINEELTERIENCTFVEFDPDFPISYDGLSDKDKRKEIQWIIQHCYIYQQPPSLNQSKYRNTVNTHTSSLSLLSNSAHCTAKPTASIAEKSIAEKAADAEEYWAQFSGVTSWTCVTCTFKNPVKNRICNMCNGKRYNTKRVVIKEQITQEQEVPQEHVVKLLVQGFGRELSDETGYEIPVEIEKLLHSYYYLCAYWDAAKVFGYFKVSGFMNECVERTENGKGSWQNMYSKQVIAAHDHYSWKLRVTDMAFITKAYGVMVGIMSVRGSDESVDDLHRAFCFDEFGFGKQVDCEYIDQIINVDLDFEYSPTVGLVTVDKYKKYLVPKFYISKNEIERRYYKFALAMGCSGVTLEFFHFGY
eukprot:220645_1